MKGMTYIALLAALLWGKMSFALIPLNATVASDSIQLTINALDEEIALLRLQQNMEFQILYEELRKTNDSLLLSTKIKAKLLFLLKKDSLNEVLQTSKIRAITDISKVRYIKGLEIIKLLYDKTLALDHHFSSMHTLSEVNKIANPNNYRSFLDAKKIIESKRDKKTGFDLTKILGDNIYTSITYSIISLFTNTGTQKAEKESNIKEIECVLDFTLRMNDHLNTIYFETVFLQKSNESIMSQLDQLFTDFTKPIGYSAPLKECRNTDDWDRVRENLNSYLEALDKELTEKNNPQQAQKMQINLEFPIDQLLQFIAQYNSFIDQGGKFYEKFAIMLNSYENEAICADQIPTEYKTLKSGIQIAVEKFNTAYKPVEINGSKLKQILYGINEYD